MFAIEFFTGRRFGAWLASSARFNTEAEAHTAITTQVRAERAADITPFKRRAVLARNTEKRDHGPQ